MRPSPIIKVLCAMLPMMAIVSAADAALPKETRDKITERMVVSPDDAWDVPGPGKPLAPDRTRKSEYTEFILKGRFDTSDADERWLKKFMKENNLTEQDLKVGE